MATVNTSKLMLVTISQTTTTQGNLAKDKFVQLGDWNILPWSISGVETSVVVKHDKYLRHDGVVFDMGVALYDAVGCDTVFISHGHVDHIGAIHLHARKRQLIRLPPAKYYVPEGILESVRKLVLAVEEVNGDSLGILCDDQPVESPNGSEVSSNLIPVKSGEWIKYSARISILPFQTHHRVSSSGYILYSKEYLGEEIPSAQKVPSTAPEESQSDKKFTETVSVKGVPVIKQFQWVPRMAYTGDTKFTVFTDPGTPADLLSVELLITEATYLDKPETYLESAHLWAHIHLVELCENAALFQKIHHLVLIHFSNRYTPSQVKEICHASLPPSLRGKTYCATQATELR